MTAADKRVGLPIRPFLYTLDQIAMIMSVELQTVKSSYIFFDQRSTGAKSVHLMLARNIARPNEAPEWRVAETELIRWLKVKGFRYRESGTIRL